MLLRSAEIQPLFVRFVINFLLLMLSIRLLIIGNTPTLTYSLSEYPPHPRVPLTLTSTLAENLYRGSK